MVRRLGQVIASYPEPPPEATHPRLKEMASGFPRRDKSKGQDDSPTARVLDRLKELYDLEFGGFGREPKQPPWEALRLLIALYSRSDEKPLLEMVVRSLEGMKTGLYDYNDQGFFRYSVARDWRVPHYEKMLVTNANLAILYLEAYQLTGRRTYKTVAVGALGYMTGALFDRSKGTFFASQDAWEDFYRLPWKDRKVATRPPVDRTSYAGWNALAATALIRAYGAIGESSYLTQATKVLDLLLCEGWDPVRGLTHVIGGPPEQPPILEDHVYLLRGLLDLYQATGRVEWLHRSEEVTRTIQTRFGAADGGFYDTSQGLTPSDQLLPREKPVMENSLLAESLLSMSCLSGKQDYQVRAAQTLDAFKEVVPGATYLGPSNSRRMEEDEEQLFLPAGSAWARARDSLTYGPVHLVVVGAGSHPKTKNLLTAALKTYAPHRVVQLLDPAGDQDRIASLGFPARNEPALHACMGGRCLLPVTSAKALRTQLNSRPWSID